MSAWTVGGFGPRIALLLLMLIAASGVVAEGVGGEGVAESHLVIEGTAWRGGGNAVVTTGHVEVRRPGHDDRFAPVRVPLREDGSFRLELARERLPGSLDLLSLSVIAPGYTLYEAPLPGGDISSSPLRFDVRLTASTLDGILDIFSCCVLTWGILTVMLPAFLLGAAITAFVPSQHVLKFLGPDAPKPLAYGAAVSSGMILSLCSCNVIPLFLSIWYGGAGIGPAFAFLYAGPAINLVAMAFTWQVIGLGIGVFRVVAVAVLSVVVGLLMARFFGAQQGSRRVRLAEVPSQGPDGRIAAGLIGVLLYLLVVGALELGLLIRLALTLPAVGLLVWLAVFRLGAGHTREWLQETWRLLLRVVPILLPAVLLIGLISRYVPLRAVSWLSGSNSPAANASASLFGALMYFPILTETAFVKAMLKVVGLGVGPGVALLLTAPGLSLPGMIIVSRDIGWKKLIAYVTVIVVLAALSGLFFGSEWGAYLCSCMLE